MTRAEEEEEEESSLWLFMGKTKEDGIKKRVVKNTMLYNIICLFLTYTSYFCSLVCAGKHELLSGLSCNIHLGCMLYNFSIHPNASPESSTLAIYLHI